MYSFKNDYSSGACKEVLEAINQGNVSQQEGYGEDTYSKLTSNKIKELIDDQNVDVYFIPGGTPCNVLACSLLKPYQSIISCDTGHIFVHETGAIEHTGHKIVPVKNEDGKLTPEQIKEVVEANNDCHTALPKMVFISFATELGTIYSKEELIAISKTCKELNLYLYIDGARIFNGLVASNDITLKDINELADLFYIGGTKNGGMFGEAMVIKNNELKKDFRYLIKQNCCMLAKGRYIPIQFLALLNNNVAVNNASNANTMAQALAKFFKMQGVELYSNSLTNQIFPIVENKLVAKLIQAFNVSIWGKYDENHTIIRFVTSFDTQKSDIENVVREYLKIKQDQTL